jgi:hypothetical protein
MSDITNDVEKAILAMSGEEKDCFVTITEIVEVVRNGVKYHNVVYMYGDVKYGAIVPIDVALPKVGSSVRLSGLMLRSVKLPPREYPEVQETTKPVNKAKYPTDMDRFKAFLDSMKIEYTCKEHDLSKFISVDIKHLDACYGPSLDIEFDTNGKFVQFVTSGE